MNSEKVGWIEPVAGGMFGIISIIAAIVEYCMGDNGALAGCIKDISGTIIVVILLVAFLRSIPKKPKNIEGLLKNAVEEWGEGNAPLIFKADGYKAAQGTSYEQGFVLLQKPEKYVSLLNNSQMKKGSPEWKKYAKYENNGGLTGKFLNMPSYKNMTEDNFDVLFVMNQSHFKSMDDIDQIINEIISAINNSNDSFGAVRKGKAYEFTINCDQIKTKNDIEQFVKMLDFVVSLVKVVS